MARYENKLKLFSFISGSRHTLSLCAKTNKGSYINIPKQDQKAPYMTKISVTSVRKPFRRWMGRKTLHLLL